MYKLESRYIGAPGIEGAPLSAPTYLRDLPIPSGIALFAEDPVWGPGKFVFARANGAIRQYGLCVLLPVWDSTNRTYTMNMTEAPSTAIMGVALFVAQSAGAMTSGQYGWFMSSGITPVNCNATVAADTTFSIAAAGQGGAAAAGKQVVGGRIVTASTQTVAKTAVSGESGGTIINVGNTDGWFVGGYLSGTGVGASAVITSIDPLGKYVIASVANTAQLAGNTITVTYNNATVHYNVAFLSNIFAQGAIT